MPHPHRPQDGQQRAVGGRAHAVALLQEASSGVARGALVVRRWLPLLLLLLVLAARAHLLEPFPDGVGYAVVEEVALLVEDEIVAVPVQLLERQQARVAVVDLVHRRDDAGQQLVGLRIVHDRGLGGSDHELLHACAAGEQLWLAVSDARRAAAVGWGPRRGGPRTFAPMNGWRCMAA